MLEFKFEMRSVEGFRFEASLWLRGQLRRVGVSVWNVDSGGLVLDTTKRLLDFLPKGLFVDHLSGLWFCLQKRCAVLSMRPSNNHSPDSGS